MDDQRRATRRNSGVAVGAALTGVLGTDLTVLVAFRPGVGRFTRGLRSPAAWVARVGADRAAADLAGAALWCVAVWVGVGLLTLGLRGLPGAAGRCSDRVARVVVPRAAYRVVAGAIGLGVLTAPALASAATASASAATAPATDPVRVSANGPILPNPIWPTDPELPPPAWPTTSAPPTSAPPTSAPPTSAPPSTAPTTATPSPPSPPALPSTDRRPVVVRAGDSLWLIAARRLGPTADDSDIAVTTRAWYATNRATIGPDPDLITPGLVLQAPGATELP